MARRIGLGGTIVGLVAFVSVGTVWADLHRAIGRPELIEVGDPTLISVDLLQREMEHNISLRRYIDVYGWPDYAEVQEVKVPEPLLPYEVRLYYLRRNQELAYSRVFVSPAFPEFGIRTYDGPIPDQTLQRLLTAASEEKEAVGVGEATYEIRVEPAAPVYLNSPGAAPEAASPSVPSEEPLVIPAS